MKPSVMVTETEYWGVVSDLRQEGGDQCAVTGEGGSRDTALKTGVFQETWLGAAKKRGCREGVSGERE